MLNICYIDYEYNIIESSAVSLQRFLFITFISHKFVFSAFYNSNNMTMYYTHNNNA